MPDNPCADNEQLPLRKVINLRSGSSFQYEQGGETLTIYNKLVRDLIPEIIRQNGQECIVRTLDEVEYEHYLDLKLQEELDEYLASGEIAELADLLEVIYAILAIKDVGPEALERIRLEKRAKRGGFEKRWLLERVQG